MISEIAILIWMRAEKFYLALHSVETETDSSLMIDEI